MDKVFDDGDKKIDPQVGEYWYSFDGNVRRIVGVEKDKYTHRIFCAGETRCTTFNYNKKLYDKLCKKYDIELPEHLTFIDLGEFGETEKQYHYLDRKLTEKELEGVKEKEELLKNKRKHSKQEQQIKISPRLEELIEGVGGCSTSQLKRLIKRLMIEITEQ